MKYYFWYSEGHARHLRMMRDRDDELASPYGGASLLLQRGATTAVIDGVRMEYTAATTNPERPYERAMELFPDYVLLGEGDMSTFKKGDDWAASEVEQLFRLWNISQGDGAAA